MAEKLTREQIAAAAIIHAAPPLPVEVAAPAYIRNAPLDRTFELPTALYGITVGLFLAYVALMGIGFAHPEMIIPVAVFALFIVAFFGVPAIWVRLAPENPVRAKSWQRFMREGVMTPFGRTEARDAMIQVLIMPVIVFGWGIAAVTIAAIVS